MNKKILIIVAILLIIIISIFLILKNTIFNTSKFEYEIEQVENYNYLKYNEQGKFGVIDKDGNVIINAEYYGLTIPNPSKDLFICFKNSDEKPIVLNSSNEELFSQYDKIEPIHLKSVASILCYEKNTLIYHKDGLCGLLSFDGKEITKNEYNSIENLQSTEGKFIVSKDNKFGILNVNGAILVKPEYDNITTDGYYNEQTKYQKSGFLVSNTTDDGYRLGYIDYTGKELLKDEFNELSRITDSEEPYLIGAKNGQYGLYKSSKELIPPQYQSITYTDNGGLIIQKNSNFGIANLDGNILVEPKYEKIEENGIYLYASSTQESQVYDINGNPIDINFNKVLYNTDNENYRIVTLSNNDTTYYGLEDANGNSLINTTYNDLEYLFDNYFIARNDKDKFGVIDSQENTVINFKYDIIQKIKDTNIIQTLNIKDNETELYSPTLENICKMKNASITQETDYIIISNNKEKIYFDNNGNKISENSDIVTNSKNQELPDKIKDYSKIQYSLEDAYYMKNVEPYNN